MPRRIGKKRCRDGQCEQEWEGRVGQGRAVQGRAGQGKGDEAIEPAILDGSAFTGIANACGFPPRDPMLAGRTARRFALDYEPLRKSRGFRLRERRDVRRSPKSVDFAEAGNRELKISY